MGRVIRQPQLLSINPSSEIEFKGDPKQVNASQIQLRNDTNHKIGFKVMTNAPHLLFVRPASDLILPGGHSSINVMLQPCHDEKVSGIVHQHKLLIQSIIVQSEENNDNMDKLIARKANSDEVMETKLNCTFQEVYTSELVFPLSSDGEQDGGSATAVTKDLITPWTPNIAIFGCSLVAILFAILSWYVYANYFGNGLDEAAAAEESDQ